MATPTLSGDLNTFGPIHLLRLLQNTRLTGRLEFARGAERVNLFVKEGRSVFCSSSGTRLHIGEILVRQGDLRPEVVELALAVQSDIPGKRIGRILVESGSVTETQVRDALLAAQRQILCDVLLWHAGTFHFHSGECAADEDIRIELDVDRLLIGMLTFAGNVLEQQADQDAA